MEEQLNMDQKTSSQSRYIPFRNNNTTGKTNKVSLDKKKLKEPARIPMEDFLHWFDSNKFLHIPTAGSKFTWCNGRKNIEMPKKRLDRALCNLDWLEMRNKFSSNTLIKIKYDHFPILLNFEVEEVKFVSQLKFLKIWSSHESCIDVIKNSSNIKISGCPNAYT